MYVKYCVTYIVNMSMKFVLKRFLRFKNTRKLTLQICEVTFDKFNENLTGVSSERKLRWMDQQILYLLLYFLDFSLSLWDQTGAQPASYTLGTGSPFTGG
jgi:hypothetical protein